MSQKDCIAKFLGRINAHELLESAQDYQERGHGEQEAMLAAVQDKVDSLHEDRASVIQQVREAYGKPAPMDPKLVESAASPVEQATAASKDLGAFFRARVADDYSGMKNEYSAMKGTQGGRVLDVDLARELSPEYRANRSRAQEVHEAASSFIQRIFEDTIAKENPGGTIAFMAGGGGAGKSSVQKTSVGHALHDAEVVYDGTLSGWDKASKNVDMALRAGRDVLIPYVFRDPIEATTQGVLPRAMESGRPVPSFAIAKGHAGASEVVRKLAEKYAGDPRVTIVGIDNSHGRGNAKVVPLEKLPPVKMGELKERIENAVRSEHEAGRISDEVAAATLSENQRRGSRADQDQAPQDRGGDDEQHERERQGRDANPVTDSAEGVSSADSEPTEGGVHADIPRRISDGNTYAGWRTQHQKQDGEVPRIPITHNLNKAIADLDAGKITPTEFELKVRLQANRLAIAADIRQENTANRERVRGPDYVMEKLLQAKRRSDIGPETADFAIWMLRKNPQMAENLGIGIKQGSDFSPAGDYNPASQIMRLFKGHANDGTAVHEILHHTERMMPKEVQDGIRRDWAKAYAKAIRNSEGTERQALFEIPDALAGDKRAQEVLAKAFKDGTLNYDDHYALTNPSEFWAVKATDILSGRYGADTWVAKAKQWLTEMVEHAKGLVGMGSNSPILKALSSIAKGDGEFESRRMLSQSDKTLQDIPANSAEPIPGEDQIDHARTRLSGLISHGLESVSKGIDKALNKTGVYDAVAPMSAGTQQTRAMAQAHINAERKANYEWTRLDKFLTDNYTPEQQRKMWEAADEQNELLKRGASPDEMKGKGIDSLTPEERSVMDTLHNASHKLYQQAHDVGLATGEGQKYWAPRMMALVGEDGTFAKPGGDGKQATSDGTGRNITTSSKNLQQRKHDTAAESEAAMQALGGTLVRNIRTMPLAMAKLQRAIAGRQLINQIRDLGKATGKELVSPTEKPDFFTLDHPAFKTYGPRMEDGKAVVDADGNAIIDAKPLYISNEFKGPLSAIMSQKNGQIYTGYMLLKSKSMSALMYSPLIHNQVIFGRALAYGGVKTPILYWTGHAAKSDPDFMRKMIGAGMVPIGRHNTMLDVGDIAQGIGKEGGWGDPNESWIGLGAKAVGNKIAPGLGTKAKAGIDWLGDVVHNKLLWDRVGDLQAGIGKDVYDKLIAKGLDENAATTIAAHIANRYAGAIGREAMSNAAHKIANIVMFSKSFNAGNLGTVKDSFYGLPAGLRAQLAEHSDVASAAKALQFAKNKARVGIVRDLAYTVVINSIVQDLVNSDTGKSVAENVSAGLDGYMKRAAEAWVNAKNNPLKLSSYNPYRLSSTFHNEPDKQDRVDMGAQENGRHEYMRLPTGKVVEDLAGWIFHPGDTADKKESPMMRALLGLKNNAKDKYGTPIWDESNGTIHKMWDVAKFLASTQVPIDQMQTVKDIAQGHGTPLDKEKMLGNFTGLSVSQGHPGGPEAAVAAGVEDRLATSKKYVMEAVKHDIKVGDTDTAIERLTAIGMTPREISGLIRSQENPRAGITPEQRRKFGKHATDEDRAALDAVTQ